MRSEREILDDLSRAVLEMDEDLAESAANEIIAGGFDAQKAITEGLSRGMEEAGKLFEEEEYFVPELLLCSDAMYRTGQWTSSSRIYRKRTRL